MARIAFPKSGTYPSSKKKNPHGRKLSYNIASIGFTLETLLADLVVPENCTPQTQEYVNQRILPGSNVTHPDHARFANRLAMTFRATKRYRTTNSFAMG